MKKLTLLITIISFVFSSCSKEESIDSTDPNSGGGGGNNSQLVKTAIKVGQDTAVTYFSYDNQKRLVSQRFVTNSSMFGDNNEIRITRNAQGIVNRFLVIDEGTGTEKEYKVNYDGTAKRYTSKTSTYELVPGLVVNDSTVFNYNNAGQITRIVYFIGYGGVFEEALKGEYTYTSNNITSVKTFYIDSTGQYTQATTVTYEFDSKNAPLYLGAEGLVLGIDNYSSVNNATKFNLINLEDPSENQVVTSTYTYNSANRPITASVLIQSLGVPIPIQYFYN